MLFRALPGQVGSGVVADPARRSQIEVDVAVSAPAVPDQPRRILSLGEARWGTPLGARHLERLRRARDLLASRGYDTRDTVLACYGGAGFARALGQLGDRRAVEPLLERLGDPDLGVRSAVAQAVGKLGGPEEFATLLAFLAHADSSVTAAAAEALGLLGAK